MRPEVSHQGLKLVYTPMQEGVLPLEFGDPFVSPVRQHGLTKTRRPPLVEFARRWIQRPQAYASIALNGYGAAGRGARRLGRGRHELEVLLTGKYTMPEYAVAVSSWPEARPIWPLLRWGYVRIGFVRFCLNYIRLGTHPRSSRTGAASYVYARLSDRAELDDVTRQHLQVTTRLDCRRVPACLRLPLLLASSPERTLVALHLGGPPQWIDSYLFIEPWDDEIVVPRSEQWYDIVERDWIVLSDLAACDADGRLRMGADALLLPRSNSGPHAGG